MAAMEIDVDTDIGDVDIMCCTTANTVARQLSELRWAKTKRERDRLHTTVMDLAEEVAELSQMVTHLAAWAEENGNK